MIFESFSSTAFSTSLFLSKERFSKFINDNRLEFLEADLTTTIKIDIDDFKYDINKDVLKVNIDLLLTCDELEKKTEDIKKEIEEEPDELDDYLNNYFKDDMELPKEVEKTVEPVINDIDIENNISNITNTIINNENKYYTYKIYILREGDTVDTICNKYNITKEELSMYNTLSDLKIGDKIIIPEVNE